jgi:diguanylate cyclase (GGDEF)-like protein/PAS domain S-box-containing protein
VIIEVDTINAEQLLDNLLTIAPAGIFWKDKDRRFLGANQMFLDYYGLSSVDELIGKTDEDMGWHIDPDPYRKVELRVISNGETIENVPGQCIVKGKVRKITATKKPLIVDGEIVGLIGFFSDITDHVEEVDRLSALSQTDDMTGLLNRRAYQEIAAQYEKQFLKDGSDFVLFMIDLDNFKSINDTYGHEYGNLVLVSVCKSLTMAAADNSVLFRYGGDEFIILHQYKTDEEIEALKKKILHAVGGPRNIDGMNMSIKASIGHAVFSETHYLSALAELADRRMYDMKSDHKAKGAG